MRNGRTVQRLLLSAAVQADLGLASDCCHVMCMIVCAWIAGYRQKAWQYWEISEFFWYCFGVMYG